MHRTFSPYTIGLAVVLFLALAASARAELTAHWKFDTEAPFDDSVSGLTLNPESTDETGKMVFRAIGQGAPRVEGNQGSLFSPSAQGVDLRLRVNAPTRGGNPFRLSGNSWTLSGWFLYTGRALSEFGHVVAGTHGHSPLEGRGNAGWSLRVVGEDRGDKYLSALFSTGGDPATTFELKSTQPLELGPNKWTHFVLSWNGTNEATLFINGKAAGKATAPAGFDLATADRNAFRGLWIAGRQASEESDGSDNGAGGLDDLKFFGDTVADEALVAAEFAAPQPKPKPKPKPVVATKPKPVTPPPPPKPVAPPAPVEKVFAARTWTDARGKTIEASLVVPGKPVAGRVLLETSDGIRIGLPVEKLSEADQAYAKKPE